MIAHEKTVCCLMLANIKITNAVAVQVHRHGVIKPETATCDCWTVVQLMEDTTAVVQVELWSWRFENIYVKVLNKGRHKHVQLK